MEIQLKELIEQIKKDGVETAETKAQNIICEANKKAEEIIANAEAKAQEILTKAKEENEKFLKSSEESIRQAGRNLLISFRESVSRELNVILTNKAAQALSGENLSELIIKAVQNWIEKNDSNDLSVILNTTDLESISGELIASLNNKMLSGVTLKANDNFDGGFRISVNGGEVFYDYSVDSVVDMLSNYLSPKVTALLKEAR